MGGDMKGKGKGKGMKGKGKGTKGKGKGKFPDATETEVLPNGTQLTAQYNDGEWYKATVVGHRAKEPSIKVRFEGYEDDGDVWLSEDQIRSKKKGKGGKGEAALPAVGTTCDINLAEHSPKFPAVVTEVAPSRKNGPIKVMLEVWLQQHEIVKVTGKGKGVAGTHGQEGPVPVGTNLSAMAEDGNWYKAQVIKLRRGKAPVQVHFDGSPDSDDRWCTLDELRSKLIYKEDHAEPAKAKGKGKDKDAEAKGKGKGKGKDAKGKGKDKGKDKGKGKSKGDKGKGKGDKGKGKGKKGKGKGKGKK